MILIIKRAKQEIEVMNQSVLKAIELLNCFTNKYELSIIELSEMTGMPKTTVFRLLASLEEGGLLVKNRKSSHDVTYRLSFRMVEFGKVVLDQLEYRDVAYPHMKRLNEELNELVHLVTREGHEAVYVETIDSTKLIRLVVQVGRRSPLYAGSGPKLLLAHMDIDAQEEYLQNVELKKITENTIDDIDVLKNELERIKEQGYSKSYAEHFPNTIGFSFPIYDYSNKVIASLGVSIPSSDYSQDREEFILEKIKYTALAISRDLGFKG